MADKTIGELKRASVPLDSNGKVAFESSQGDAEYFEISDLEDVAVAAVKEHTDAAKREADRAKTEAEAAAESARDAADVALHPPILKDGSDHWWTWSTEANDYVESDKDAGVSLTIGDVITGAPGTEAKVTNRGTATDPIWDITIPEGKKGETGDIGPEGPRGETGETGPQGPVGPAGGVNSFNGEQGDIEFPVDSTPMESSQNAVQSGGVYDALAGKQDAMTAITSQDIDTIWDDTGKEAAR